jgi:hypothetical protein
VPSSLLVIADREDGGGGATRYARPCRPVKPLLMMELVGRRSVRHFWHCRYEVDVSPRYEGRVDGDVEGELNVEVMVVETED